MNWQKVPQNAGHVNFLQLILGLLWDVRISLFTLLITKPSSIGYSVVYQLNLSSLPATFEENIQ